MFLFYNYAAATVIVIVVGVVGRIGVFLNDSKLLVLVESRSALTLLDDVKVAAVVGVVFLFYNHSFTGSLSRKHIV